MHSPSSIRDLPELSGQKTKDLHGNVMSHACDEAWLKIDRPFTEQRSDGEHRTGSETDSTGTSDLESIDDASVSPASASPTSAIATLRIDSDNHQHERIIDSENHNYSNEFYSPLNVSKQEIRLLEVIATSPIITCNLETVSLHEEHVFSALSYVWGDMKDTESIFVNGERVDIGANLARAIRAAHNHLSLTNSKKIWADALCINQSDVREKNHQIPLMRTIYGTADCTLACLGSAASNDEMSDVLEAIEYFSEPARMWSLSPSRKHARKYLANWFSTHIEADDGVWHTTFAKLETFEHDPYWGRVWTYQEVAIGHPIHFISFNMSLSLDQLIVTKKFSRMCVAHMNSMDTEVNLSPLAQFLLEGISRSLNAIHVAEAAGKSLKKLEECPYSSRQRDEILVRRLRECCLHAEERHATEPKDYVYGYAAFFPSVLQPDYSPQKAVASVFADLAEQILLMSGGRSLSFLSYAGIGFDWQTIPGLPSWAPNLSGCATSRKHNRPELRDNSTTYQILISPIPTIIRTTGSFHCTAVFMDTCVSIGPNKSSLETDDTSNVDNFNRRSFDRDMKWLFTILFHASASGQPVAPKLHALIYALVPQNSDTSHNATATPAQRWWRYLYVVVYELVQISKKKTFEGAKNRESFLESLLPDGKDRVNFRIYENERRDHPDRSRAIYEAGYKDLAMFYPRWRTSRLGYTSRARFGMFPPFIQTGDLIAKIDGLSKPVVLRKVDQHYTFVQFCSIPAYDGIDVFLLVQAGTVKWSRIEIR